MYKVIEFENEEKYIHDFLTLPKKLYDKKTLMQDEKQESQILSATNTLSKYFKLHKYLVYLNDKVVARCILTMYPKDDVLYFGFFESFNDKQAVKALLDEIHAFANKNKYKKIVGPVNCSFWINYRMKVNRFDKLPYTGEPYNKEYYFQLFLDNEYIIKEEYVSNFFERLPVFSKKISSDTQKYKDRYKEFNNKGYQIVSPKRKDFDKVLKEVYSLLMELYEDFPIFKHLSEEDFLEHFKNYTYILDYSMVKMAYYEGQAVGFFIGVPDYKNLLYTKINLLTYVKVFLKKIRSSNYVMLYMGVKKEHQGLGKAIVRLVFKNVLIRRSTAITALTKEGRKTKTYFEDNVESVYKYVLLERIVGSKK